MLQALAAAAGMASNIAGAAAPYVGMYLDNKNAEANLAMQKDNLAYQKWAQQVTWDREDSAAQRKAADLEAAGLSKTLAAGSSASTSAPIKTEAPQKRMEYTDKIVQGMQGI